MTREITDDAGVRALLRDAPGAIARLTIQTEWPSLARRAGDGTWWLRLCAAPTSTQALAAASLDEDSPEVLPHVVGAMPVLGELPRLAILQVEGDVRGALPSALGGWPITQLLLEDWIDAPPLPAEVGRLARLTELRLPAALERLDAQLAFRALRELRISLALLRAHAGELANLVALEQLVVQRPATCTPGRLPDELGALRALRVLDISRLELVALPDSIAQLAALEHLDVRHNQLTRIAPIVARLPQAVAIAAEGNRLAQVEATWLEEQMPKRSKKRAAVPAVEPVARDRFIVEAWDAIASVATSRELVVAGQRGGYGVCAWDARSGALLWTRTLVETETSTDVDALTTVAFGRDGEVIAGASTGDGLVCWLSRTGEIVREHRLGPASAFQRCFVAAGGTLLLANARNTFGDDVSANTAFRLPDLAPIPWSRPIGAISPNGRLATVYHDDAVELVSLVDATAPAVVIARIAPHAFRCDDSLVFIDAELVGHEYAIDGRLLRSFPVSDDVAALPRLRRPTAVQPWFDPTGQWMMLVRQTARPSAVDNTVAIYRTDSMQRIAQERHQPLRGRLDPRYGASHFITYSPVEYPALGWLDGTLLVAALARRDDEPLIGTGLETVPVIERTP